MYGSVRRVAKNCYSRTRSLLVACVVASSPSHLWHWSVFLSTKNACCVPKPDFMCLVCMQLIGNVARVKKFTSNSGVMVEVYGDSAGDWVVNPKVISKVHMLKVGDRVRLKADKGTVKNLQAGHGGWIEAMSRDLGKVGQIVKVYTDRDVRVDFGINTWTLNPNCLDVVSEDSVVATRGESEGE